MKWPLNLTFIRHGESAYNVLKPLKLADPEYQEFVVLFDKEYAEAHDAGWASDELKDLAYRVWQKNRLLVSDYDTPLTEAGKEQARTTGSRLNELMTLPDIVYVSPYVRTRQTLAMLQEGWPELKDVKTVFDERIREQEHGLSTIYNDWRVYLTLNPEQALLMKAEGEYAYRYLNGENKPDVRDRGRSFLATLVREHSGENVLMVSHHLTLLSFRALLERWDREQFIEVDTTDKPLNCGVTVYRGRPLEGHGGRMVLDLYNKKLY